MKLKKNYIHIISLFLLSDFVNCEQKGEFSPPTGTQIDEPSSPSEETDITKDERISIIEDQMQEALKTLDEIQHIYPKLFEEVLKKSANISIAQSLVNRLTLPPRCGELIRKGDFVRAHDALNFIHPDDYDEVIKEAFQNNTETFRKIVDFADTLAYGNSDGTFILYKNLMSQAKTLGYFEEDGYRYAMTHIAERGYDSIKWSLLKSDIILQIFKIYKNELKSVP